MNTFIRIILALHFIIFSAISMADYKDDVGYTRLSVELGINTPTGGGVLVSHVEAPTSYVDTIPVYLPDAGNTQFDGKIITNVTGLDAGEYSGHATSVGALFYGSNSIALGVDYIDAYEANYWLQPDFLRFGNSRKPLSSSSRVANHSWVGNYTTDAENSSLLRRMDWVIETDEFIQAVGTKNGTGANLNILSGAYNVIAVGRTDGLHGTGTSALDSDYTSGRTKPEIVAPKTTTSSATPIISATVAVLVETGHSNLGLSTDLDVTSITNREGDTIYNAERSEVIKAALMAGADRLTINGSGVANITDYRVDLANQAVNGLDARFGAGQINVYNSYHIIAAGEQNSNEDDGSGAGNIGVYGFDYDPSFGPNGSNNIASYYFSTGTDPKILLASLSWNIDIDGGNVFFDETATLYDLDLFLYDVTGAQSVLISSTSSIDNTENIWTSLSAGRDYLLQVVPKAGQSDFEWDYALAWQIATDTDGDGVSDTQDNCTDTSNADQVDMDSDTIGDVCDSDIDGDGMPNSIDAFPYDPAEDTDTDGDAIGNNSDTDDDNDGVSDILETDPLNPYLCGDSDGDICDDCSVGADNFGPLSDQLPGNDGLDTDIDGLCNVGDLDDDNDGLTDVEETVLGTNPLIADTDGDGLSDFDEVSMDGNPTTYTLGVDTDPNNLDTDGDGYGDGEEVTFGSNPLDDISLPIAANGDLNNDGIVNVVDVMIGQQILNGQVDPTLEQLHYADVAPLVDGTPSSDGLFNVGDLVVIQRMATGLVSF